MKKSRTSPRAPSLDRERIVAEAVALLDEAGYDELSLRRLADRLGVRAPTLYWHLRNKADLISALADAILADELAEDDGQPDVDDPERPPEGQTWQGRLTAMAERLRRAMLAHTDGARVVSAGHLSTRLADLSERAIRDLVASGVSLRDARLTVLVVQNFTVGYVLSEQSPPPDAEASGFDVEEFGREHPLIVAAIGDYFDGSRDRDDLFRDLLGVILRRESYGSPEPDPLAARRGRSARSRS